ncbi:hypothetical protein DICPUDRAFT_153305 [Dictyostelium purpureum]|uniref:ABC transporter domain-containing protein n=1 Tax=Dictyostelium purpureum TaxID=5786 RepID=F0ZNK0_DICPU|nr:uncharacterized protein DICPUDRAFT_153305 [Dictyostelium purpureum]EGC34470.1 hypothetical protein DICPUDRAFT_153305 [Dictyostelium purpureum]|eukprot:XP_003289005.1 hypothetical protein DICPUDRAFT_153305 [Dictyostelium purpureum]
MDDNINETKNIENNVIENNNDQCNNTDSNNNNNEIYNTENNLQNNIEIIKEDKKINDDIKNENISHSIELNKQCGSEINNNISDHIPESSDISNNNLIDTNNINYNNVGVQITFENLSYKVINLKYKKQLKIKKKYEEQINKLKRDNKQIDLEKMESNEYSNQATRGGDVIEKELTILSNVSGVIEKGEMTALFGPSGSGKSTLLDILAKRKSTGSITGKLLVNGKELGDAYKKYCSYVTQEEILLETSTVEETLKLHADLRLPGMSDNDKWKRVYQVLQDIGLTKKAKSKIGGVLPGGMVLKGLSGGEKKRVSIGCALVTNPSLLLLDEPTSGLDSTSALVVMKVLQNLTQKGVTVIFNLFTKIMVVLKGRMFYIGGDVLGYLASLGYKCPNHENPADFCLDSCIEIANSSDFTTIVDNWDNYYKNEVAPTICNNDVNKEVDKGVSMLYQYKVLQHRSLRYFLRNKIGFASRVVIGLLVGLLFSACFGGLKNTQEDISKETGALFFLMASLSLLPYACISTFLSTRTLFNSERASKIYKTLPFFLSSMFIEIFVGIVVSAIVVIIVYTISNFRWNFVSFILTYFGFLFIHLFSVFMVIAVSNITGTVDLTFTYSTGLSIIYLLFAGFFVPVNQLPKSFGWLHYINPLHYGFSSLMIAQFKDREIECPTPVPNDPSSICLYPNGNLVLKQFSLQDYTYGETLGILIVWTFFYYCLAYFAIHYFNKEKR